MKTALVRVLPVLFFFVFAKFADAGDFVSAVIQPGTTPIPITVPANRFLVIRNFTQVSPGPPTSRGVVEVTSLNGVTIINANILAAAIIDSTNPAPGVLEPINNVVVAGPASVSVTCDLASTCFVTYRKGED
jgi:hypothetical protein